MVFGKEPQKFRPTRNTHYRQKTNMLTYLEHLFAKLVRDRLWGEGSPHPWLQDPWLPPLPPKGPTSQDLAYKYFNPVLVLSPKQEWAFSFLYRLRDKALRIVGSLRFLYNRWLSFLVRCLCSACARHGQPDTISILHSAIGS